MNKQQRKATLKQWKHAERADLLAAMPFSPQQLHELLNYLDANVQSCDHTMNFTRVFLNTENLDLDKALPWLGERGGYCDCEVLANLADLNESLQAPPPMLRIVTQQKQNRTPRNLDTITGWSLADLRAPWRVANPYTPNEPVRLELGKKGGCAITIVESPLPPGDLSSNEFWSTLWYARTKLSPRGDLQVTHAALTLPEGFGSTLVRSASWIPVFCWVVPQGNLWHMEIRTELNRYGGDLPQISSLISHLATGQA